MLYSDLYLQKRRYNSFILMSLVAVLMISAATFYFFDLSALPTRASKNIVKRNNVVNLSAHQAGVYWEVEQADQGWIVYGTDPNKLGSIALDYRDTSRQKEKYKQHYAVFESLQADTTYYYKLISDNRLIEANGNQPFTFRTTKELSVSSPRSPAYGKVVLPNGQPAQDVMVILTYQNGYPVLATTKMSGEWLIPLQYVINKDTNQMETVQEEGTAKIEIVGEEARSEVEVMVNRMSPIPQTIILGQSYRFMEEKDEVLPAFIKRETQKNKTYTIDVTYPKDGAIIAGAKPLIRGIGVPGNDVIVNINTKPPFATEVTIDDRGDWKASVNRTILPGSYNLIITTEDAFGRKVGFKRKFTIAKSGEQVVLAESTGSATLTPSVTPSPTVSAGVTISPTTAVFVTMTPEPTIDYDITDVPEPPATGGGNFGPYIITGLGLLILGAGIFLVL